MEHGGPSPWPSNPDPHASRHGSIANGYNSAMSPPNEPHFQTPPLPQTPHYGQPPPMTAYSNGPYLQQYGGTSAQMRRKQVRATQACNHCRSRKQKCDEARPCQFCRENNFDCQYKDVPPPKQDRSMMQLQDSVNSISDTLKNFVDNFNIWKQHVDTRLSQSKFSADPSPAFDHASPQHAFAIRGTTSEQHTPRLPTPVQGRTQHGRVSSMKTESPVVTHSHISPAPVHGSTPIKRESYHTLSQQPATPAESVATTHTQAAADTSNDSIGLKSDHKTPAHLLFAQWPSMSGFCSGISEIQALLKDGKKIEDYPLLLEQDRGLLRIWGVGEGHEPNDGAHGPSTPESHLDMDSPSPASVKEGLWGYPPVDNPSPSTVNGDYPRRDAFPGDKQVGGLGPDGKPDFRNITLWRLYDSYMQNIHNLHPFLNPAKLRTMVREFGEVYSPDRRNSAMSPSGIPERLNGGIKRKRSSSIYGDGYGVDDFTKGNIERSLRNAIILLVLALGKCCAYTEKLPAPQNDKSLVDGGAGGGAGGGSWGYFRDSPRSATASLRSDTSETPGARNIEVLPGMAYFAYATDILGNQQGGNTVAHAQAMLLAALYLGQYGRVLESWSWINNACRVCLFLIKAEGEKVERPQIDDEHPKVDDSDMSPAERHRLNLVKCVYWTCLQMETDILAEMSELQPSKISELQDKIMYPSGVWDSFNDALMEEDNSDENSHHNKIMWIYSSQIHLRVMLNGAHNTLYGDRLGFDSSNMDEIAKTARSHAGILASWRRLLPPALSWEDDEPPSTDINIARMRAKYYGAHYVILRPFLYNVIHNMNLPPTIFPHSTSPAQVAESSGTPTDTHRDLMDLSFESQQYLRIALSCIESAIQSTIAFDRIGAHEADPYTPYVSQRRSRLIVPNIFGTLHAQFGNILVLTSVYRSNLRRHLPKPGLLTKEVLTALFERTISILSDMADNSPILKMDMRILQNVKDQNNL
ncbi:hypothetical protein N0V90_002127 [Kalmusia sp. IMI 367209]|nr:hypothetical protein N0V90_002127 [Kalmusia sp. IMI 367209]